MNAWDFTTYFPGTTVTAVAETSNSWFLFSNDQVIKILKPLRRAAVDLSNVANRQRELKDEFELLNAFTPAIADRIVPLKTGETVNEVALFMRRIPRGTNLLARLLTGRVQSNALERVGSTLAKIHQKQQVSDKAGPLPDAAALRLQVEDAIAPLLEHNASMFLSHDTAMRTRERLLHMVDTLAGYVQTRLKQKKIRSVHGNLQAGNIYIEPEIISFLDPERRDRPLAIGDVLSDLACALKDIRMFVSDEDANGLVRAYLGRAADENEAELLLFYEILSTLRQFVIHTAELGTGNGGPVDTELVQRYRQRLSRFVARAVVVRHDQGSPQNQKLHAQRKSEARAMEHQRQQANSNRKQIAAQQKTKSAPAKHAPMAPMKVVVKKTAAKHASAKMHAKPAPPKKNAAKKPLVKKITAKNVPMKKPAAKKSQAKKSAPKKVQPKKIVKKQAPKKAPAKKAPVKKAPAKKQSGLSRTLSSLLGLKKR